MLSDVAYFFTFIYVINDYLFIASWIEAVMLKNKGLNTNLCHMSVVRLNIKKN